MFTVNSVSETAVVPWSVCVCGIGDCVRVAALRKSVAAARRRALNVERTMPRQSVLHRALLNLPSRRLGDVVTYPLVMYPKLI